MCQMLAEISSGMGKLSVIFLLFLFLPSSLESMLIRLFLHFFFQGHQYFYITKFIDQFSVIVLLSLLAFDTITSSLWKFFLHLASSTSHPPGSLSTPTSHSSYSPGMAPGLHSDL